MLQLREIAEVYSGMAIKVGRDGEDRLLRLADLTEIGAGRTPRLARGTVSKVARAVPVAAGDLILGARGRDTAACLAGPDVVGAYVSLDLYLVRPQRAQLWPEYLWAFLRLPSTQAALALGKQGTGLERLPKEALEALAVPLPPLLRQKLVAELALTLEKERNLLRRLGSLKQEFELGVLGQAITGAQTEVFGRSS